MDPTEIRLSAETFDFYGGDTDDGKASSLFAHWMSSLPIYLCLYMAVSIISYLLRMVKG